MKAPDVDERALLARAGGGDTQAFTQLVLAHQDAVLALCRRYLGQADAEDVTQEAFVRAFTHRADLDPARPLRPWLFTVARRLCIDRLRRRGVSGDLEDSEQEVVEPAAGPDDQAAGRQRLGQLRAALAGLPEGQREAVALYHFDEVSYADIATVLGVPLGTVMTWLHRGRAALKRTVEGDHER
jgi:RNA polymerase sigma-70 factor, ECF subfamily